MSTFDITQWEPKREWWRRGENFLVMVKHHTEPVREESGCYDSEGANRWCVYAYIFPKHPHFAAFDGTDTMWQDATTRLPFHGGPSYCRAKYDASGNVDEYKVGADYHHLHDWPFTQAATEQEAYAVFADAQELFETLQTMAATGSRP